RERVAVLTCRTDTRRTECGRCRYPCGEGVEADHGGQVSGSDAGTPQERQRGIVVAVPDPPWAGVELGELHDLGLLCRRVVVDVVEVDRLAAFHVDAGAFGRLGQSVDTATTGAIQQLGLYPDRRQLDAAATGQPG